MIVQVFSIYDTVAAAFNRPFYLHNIPMAVREVEHQLEIGCEATPKSDLARNAKYSILYHLGSYDDSTGVFSNLVAPQSLGSLIQYLPVAHRARLTSPTTESEEVFVGTAQR